MMQGKKYRLDYKKKIAFSTELFNKIFLRNRQNLINLGFHFFTHLLGKILFDRFWVCCRTRNEIIQQIELSQSYPTFVFIGWKKFNRKMNYLYFIFENVQLFQVLSSYTQKNKLKFTNLTYSMQVFIIQCILMIFSSILFNSILLSFILLICFLESPNFLHLIEYEIFDFLLSIKLFHLITIPEILIVLT